MTRIQRLLLALAMLPCAATAQAPVIPEDPPSTQPPQSVISWIKSHAVGIGSMADAPSPAEASTISHIIAGATLIGVGEPGHGMREPLEYRNRLIAHLVRNEGLTAVALESGLAGGYRINRYVEGAAGVPEALARDNLSWGFGGLAANVELIRWLRDWNATHPQRQVRFYGIDASVLLKISPAPELDANQALSDVLDFLAKSRPAGWQTVHARLAPFRSRLTSDGWRAMSEPERTALQADLNTLEPLFTAKVASTSEAEWTARVAHDLRLLPGVLGTWTLNPAESEKLRNAVRIRDAIMADNVLWALHREGPKGRLLVFASNGHVAAAPMAGSIMRQWKPLPPVMGNILRQRLAGKYRVIMSNSSGGKDATDQGLGSVDRAFAASRLDRALLNVRPASDGWWSTTQSLSQGAGRHDDTVPKLALDGIVYFRQLNPAAKVDQARTP